MKIKDGFLLREVAGSHIVVPLGGAADFGGMMTLNPVGAFLWAALEADTDDQALVENCFRHTMWTRRPPHAMCIDLRKNCAPQGF